uniref:VWFA domain-containing protein n=1 Tax=Chromera velia CCMP2878 TaxID=1169474 RepID=A0A0G4I0I6_9ALVE|eukprot:Cvel_1637.t1-p1 / transcript=Cvel_1637.t1 / gene=Cvel_1637 / organism=Chromera_velia_CCMP2878 / gene_product=Alpha-protein kinase vwkA, putative / transcript_product=Alpha-protein kinase vwkA, putative / location=Cvel_scaffold58:137840-139198(+) / protein_length=367 / sequence_SO=supercontig / SO=protein_coding / is_pseudo=false
MPIVSKLKSGLNSSLSRSENSSGTPFRSVQPQERSNRDGGEDSSQKPPREEKSPSSHTGEVLLPTIPKGGSRLATKTRSEWRFAQLKQLAMDDVDLLFVIDGTASMDPWIRGVRQVVKVLVDQLKAHTRIRIAVLIYRDICDGDKQFEFCDFTEDPSKIEKALSKVKAFGGGDICEDVMSALMKAYHPEMTPFSWRDDENVSKCILHICDAPPHGTEFHHRANRFGIKYDGHPDGISTSSTRDSGRFIEVPEPSLILEDMRECNFNLFTLMVASECKKMVEKFRTWYDDPKRHFKYTVVEPPIVQSWLQDSDKVDTLIFAQALGACIQSSVMSTIRRARDGVQTQRKLTTKESNFSFAEKSDTAPTR